MTSPSALFSAHSPSCTLSLQQPPSPRLQTSLQVHLEPRSCPEHPEGIFHYLPDSSVWMYFGIIKFSMAKTELPSLTPKCIISLVLYFIVKQKETDFYLWIFHIFQISTLIKYQGLGNVSTYTYFNVTILPLLSLL